jgi:hypothetical protein
MNRALADATCLAIGLSGEVYAQSDAPKVPATESMKLSQIIAKVEQRDQFQYVSEVSWDEEGFYDVIYFTSDKAKVEIKIDPATGQPR